MQASHLKRLALYFDVGTKMWKPEEDWQQLSPQAWDDLFRPGIAVEQGDEPSETGNHPAFFTHTLSMMWPDRLSGMSPKLDG